MSEQLYIVQATTGPAKLDCFVDCSEPGDLASSETRAAELLDPSCWCNGIVGKVRIVKQEESNCYGGVRL